MIVIVTSKQNTFCVIFFKQFFVILLHQVIDFNVSRKNATTVIGTHHRCKQNYVIVNRNRQKSFLLLIFLYLIRMIIISEIIFCNDKVSKTWLQIEWKLIYVVSSKTPSPIRKSCRPTEPQEEGPYYIPNAPMLRNGRVCEYSRLYFESCPINTLIDIFVVQVNFVFQFEVKYSARTTVRRRYQPSWTSGKVVFDCRIQSALYLWFQLTKLDLTVNSIMEIKQIM